MAEDLRHLAREVLEDVGAWRAARGRDHGRRVAGRVQSARPRLARRTPARIGEMDAAQREIVSTAAVTEEPLIAGRR